MTENEQRGDAPGLDLSATPSATIHRFPRKPRYTAQDHEDFGDARRLVFMRQALPYLLKMHDDLHGIFGEVIKTSDPWPFFSVRQMQNYVEPQQFDLFTRNPPLIDSARAATQTQREQSMEQLSKALLADAGATLSETSGLNLREDIYSLRRNEAALRLIGDVVDDTNSPEQQALAKAVRVTQHGLRFMFNLGGTLSETGRKALGAVATDPLPSPFERDTSYLTPRRQHLRLAEHWLHVAVAEMALMKIELLADYRDPDRSGTRQADMFDGALVQATPPQHGFIQADAQSSRDLKQAAGQLHLALLS